VRMVGQALERKKREKYVTLKKEDSKTKGGRERG